MTELNIENVIESTAYAVRGRYKDYVDKEDLVSEGWLWVVTHPKEIKKYERHAQPGLAAWWLGRDIWKALDKFARKERAAYLGYIPEDEQAYPPGIVAVMLPHVFAGDPAQPVTNEKEVKNQGDPAHGGDWLAMYLDVKRAWQFGCQGGLTDNEALALFWTFRDGLSQEAVGDALSVDQTTAGRTVQRALKKLSDWLSEPKG